MERRRPSIPSGREHLQALAERHGIKSYTPKERLHPPSSLPQYAGPADHEEATKVLAGARRAGEKFKDPSKKLVNRFKSQSKKSNLDRAENWDFTFEERALLFDDNVRSSGNISLAQALLEYKGDDLLDTSTRGGPAAKVARRISKVGTLAPGPSVDPDEWLSQAVLNNSIQHVILLASRRPSVNSLNRAFEAAISSNASIAIVEELLRYGIDPNEHSDKLNMFIHHSRTDMIEAFLRSSRPLQPVQLNSALAQAIDQKKPDLAQMLLVTGADPNYAAAKSFLGRIREGDYQMTLLILTSAHDSVKLRLEYLDHAISLVVQETRSSEDQRYDLLDCLLAAGASRSSKALEDELFRAVNSSSMKIVKLLVSCGTSIDHNEARCVRVSLESQNFSLFELLVRGRTTTGSLSKAFPLAMALHNRSDRLHAVQILLRKNIKGAEVSASLVQAIEQDDQQLFDELLGTTADPNAFDGKAMQVAFRAQDPRFLERLCKGDAISRKTAAHMVPLALSPSGLQESRTAVLVKACKGHTDVLDRALIDEVALHGARKNIIDLLLENGASVDASNGAALYQAAASGQEHTIHQLAKASPSHMSLHAAFRAAASILEVSVRYVIMQTLLETAKGQKIGQDDALIAEAKAASSIGTDIVSLLLKHNASVDHQEGKAIKEAITSESGKTLELLLSAHPSQQVLVMAFTTSMGLAPQTRVRFISMIAKEAMQAPTALPVGLYLEQAVMENDLELVKLLLHFGADPNINNGKSFIQAAQLGGTAIFEELLVYRPDIKRLLPSLIRELSDEEKVVACLTLCFEHLKIQLNPSENVLLFLALDQFEEGQTLIKFLLGTGCSASATRELQLRENSDVEAVTPLIWALSRPLPGPSKAVLLALLEKGAEAEPDFVTTVSNTTAVLEAAKSGRHAILSKLISLGAKVNTLDADGNSALLLASESGNVASVTALLQSRIRPNDGSLHAAARGAHEQIVQLLLDSGHTPNHIHTGRNALAELCLHGYPDGNDWSERAYWVTDTLIKRGTNLEARFSGKNLLHLALDNDMAGGILKVLLDFPHFSEHLNEDSFLYEDANGTVFSPTSYAETFYNGTATERTKLVKLLEDKNCARNMWNRQGRHPPGYTYNTMPAHLKAMIDQEKIEELKHAKELQRRQEQARVERELADRNHKHLMDQATARHRHEAMEAQQREVQRAAADVRRQEAEKRHKGEIALAEAQSLRDKHQLEINQQSALATQRQQIEDRDRARAHRHQQQMNALELERTTNESRLNDQNLARQMQLLERQDQSVRMRANEMRSVAQAAQVANTNVGLNGPGTQPPRQIGFGNDWATVD